MKPIDRTEPLSHSAELVTQNIEQLQALFPEAFVEGKIDFEVLKQLLGGAVDEREERFGLNWHGKRQARQLALTPSTGTLRPRPEESVDWGTTQNLLIEGDNLEVLKLLQKSYSGMVKLITIDPPYNTGNDFVYEDDFKDSIAGYLAQTGQINSSGERYSSNSDTSGRFHTRWLNMMAPRLRLARGLLADDGSIFITIADHEVHNLRAIMDDIFGAENFVATLIWQKVFSPKNTAKHFSEDHDYVVVYAKSAESWRPTLLPRTEEMEARYANVDNDPRGPWTSGDLSARNFYGEGTYSITSPSGRIIAGPPPGTYWRVSKDKFAEMDKDKRIWWGADGNNVPRQKRFLSDVKEGRVPQTFLSYQEVGHTQEAKKELMAAVPISESISLFDTPKPTRLLRRFLQLACSGNGIVLDFFAGTGSTMHAVMLQNMADNSARRCILVQLPEPMPVNSQFSRISDVTKARLISAASSIKTENPMFAGDLGFRVFKLDSSNLRAWDPATTTLATDLEAHARHDKSDRTEQDLLFEVLLKRGLDLCVPIEQRTIAGKVVHAIGGGILICCFADVVGTDDVTALATGIADWVKVLAPADSPTLLFRDSAFDSDIVKVNLTESLSQHGFDKPGQVRSL